MPTPTSEAQEIIEIYAKRWSVELFFKDCKQLLYFGKEQNRGFDAIIAHHSLVFIRLYRNLLHPASEGMRQCLQNPVRANG